MGTSSRHGAGAGAPPYVTPTAPPWSVLALLPRAFWPWIKNYYGYAAAFRPLVASLAASQNIAIQNDAFFIVLAATCIATTTDDLTRLGFAPSTVQINDGNSGANFFNQAIGTDEFFGDAAQPGLIAFPYVVSPGGNIQVTLTNLEATNRNYRVTLHGFKAKPNSNENTGDMAQA